MAEAGKASRAVARPTGGGRIAACEAPSAVLDSIRNAHTLQPRDSVSLAFSWRERSRCLFKELAK